MPKDPRDQWSIFHFTQSNPSGPAQRDVPALLRRIADAIADLGDVEVQDVTFEERLDDDGDPWPSVTVYYHRTDDTEIGPSA